MPKKKEGENAYVKQETTFLVAVIALFIGFLGGVVFATYVQVSSDKKITQEKEHAHTEPDQAQAGRALMMVQALEQETQRHPDNMELWIQLGNSYFDNNMYQKAIDAYQKAMKIDPNNANVLTDMGVMYRRIKQPEKAIQAFEKATSVDPAHEKCRFNKGIVLMHDLNDMDGAVKTWEELAKINPLAKGPNGQLLSEFLDKIKTRQK
ncbi:MAG: tetratricopeptide repeat protein [Desulfobacterales bacterium]|nr:tetratricopeptide repeat protein [Desulfobacterales bacterium]